MTANSKAFILGLTGGIACGKSTVAARLAELGAIRVDADAITVVICLSPYVLRLRFNPTFSTEYSN